MPQRLCHTAWPTFKQCCIALPPRSFCQNRIRREPLFYSLPTQRLCATTAIQNSSRHSSYTFSKALAKLPEYAGCQSIVSNTDDFSFLFVPSVIFSHCYLIQVFRVHFIQELYFTSFFLVSFSRPINLVKRADVL